jgi:hypothetical protein
MKSKRCWVFAVLLGIIILVLILPVNAANSSIDNGVKKQIIYKGNLVDERDVGPGLPPANWTVNNTADSSIDNGVKKQIIYEGNLVDERDVGPGLPPANWTVDATASETPSPTKIPQEPPVTKKAAIGIVPVISLIMGVFLFRKVR